MPSQGQVLDWVLSLKRTTVTERQGPWSRKQGVCNEGGVRLLRSKGFPQHREGENPLGGFPRMSYNFCIVLSPQMKKDTSIPS